MKRYLATLIFFLVFFPVFITLHAAPVYAGDFRSELIGLKSIRSAWTIDAHHTAIWGGDSIQSKAFKKEFIELCKKHGGIEVNYQEKDPITDQWSQKWAPFDIQLKRAGFTKTYQFKHPKTNEKLIFMSRGDQVLYRVAGVFEMTTKFMQPDKYQTIINGFIVRHDAPQEFNYRISGVDSTSLASLPPEGDLFRAAPFKHQVTWGEWYQYLVALSKAHGGQPTWVIEEEGQLKEATAFDAYNYVNSATNSFFPRKWFLLSKGGRPFTVKRAIGQGVNEMIMVHRPASDLSYAALGSGPSRQIAPEPQLHGQPASGVQAQLALAAALIQTNTTSRANANDLSEVTYHGLTAHGATHVTVTQFFAPDGTDKKQLLEANDYHVLNGQVVKIETDMIAESILPLEVENLIPAAARDAQKLGAATAIYQDYIVTGQAVRDKRKCDVEIKVFKSGALVTSRVVDGCNS